MSDPHSAPPAPTLMAREIAEVPEVLARQADTIFPRLAEVGRELARRDPPVFITIARGSSDHAALYLKYLVEILLGIPCASVGPSIASVYHAPLRVGRAVAVTISQSGRSPDLLALQAAAKAGGALTLALVNAPDSPVGREADICLPLAAGPERSVAATKSMIASLSAGAALAASWAGADAILEALRALPGRLSRPAPPSASAIDTLSAIETAYVIGRGATFPAAAEAALKLKETSAIQAEAFSSAEVLHGPSAVVRPGFPVLAFMPQDEAREGVVETIDRLAARGAVPLAFDAQAAGPGRVGIGEAGHPLLAPIPQLQAFYALAEAVARRRGRDPDSPPGLSKVTETL